MKRISLGICIGASTITFVRIGREDEKTDLISTESIIHLGNPHKTLSDYFEQNTIENISVVVTGRKFKSLVNTISIPEPESIEIALRHTKYYKNYNVIASLGAENFIVYLIDNNGSIQSVRTGNKCAAGTGEFFLQQLSRMNLSVEEAVELARESKPYIVSGRCSVFCKSDCTHALNKGIPKQEVVAGLCKMIAEKGIELLTKQDLDRILIIGGVSQNSVVVDFIKEVYPNSLVPKEATYFEALGAALYGLDNISYLDKNNIFKEIHFNFPILPKIKGNDSNVIFKEIKKSKAEEGDVCLIGLDVGSTTTKAVIIREKDNALLASIYLRTNGNPVQASIECYKELKKQIDCNIKIIGLGTTGSGRKIAALHALTEGEINEIIAHAVAAAFFDKDVDTIFEIGGQDAKYTYLTNGIASDYAMNEACSAGTGSFLEESAQETLNIHYKKISDIAISANKPLNFNDQCSAFISSDIKNASHDGTATEDIVAGLVYSICMNYTNRVKGNRPVGKKVFMQGGVCYNKSVPLAMSNLIGKQIIVPPEPGLMGAFGVALEVKNRINLGLMKSDSFDLNDLINRRFEQVGKFICKGGKEKCDLKCEIAIFEIEGKKYPFGGACNKYYNERVKIEIDSESKDYVKKRQDLVFQKYVSNPQAKGKRIGISKSFMTNNFYPLYYNFFNQLGFEVILADNVDKRGAEKKRSAFCYPAEIAHGFFQDLINKKVDYIFMPHIVEMAHPKDFNYSKLCIFVQGENYYLKSTFRNEINCEMLSPIIDFSKSEEDIQKIFVDIAKKLKKNKSDAEKSFKYAYKIQNEMLIEFKELGKKAIKEIEEDKNKFGIVLFGRSYNAFAKEANLNIPYKFSSKNITIIPHDFLPIENLIPYENMYWYSGQLILSSAKLVKRHPKLFGVFITNFSCGPDSFILHYFRKIMGNKPSLTLELDSHSADVGINTRIDAALDIINNFIQLKNENIIIENEIDLKSNLFVDTVDFKPKSQNRTCLKSPDVDLLIPSMGRFGTEALSEVFRYLGVNCKPLPIPSTETLKAGQGLTTCKECLPFIITTGSLVEYVKKNNIRNRKTLFFMPHGYGPCRQGQYFILLKDIIRNLNLDNIAIYSMDEEQSFQDLGSSAYRWAWIAISIADVIADISNTILALSVDKKEAFEILEIEWLKVKQKIFEGNEKKLFKQLKIMSENFKKIQLKEFLNQAKKVMLIGEVYVRQEEFSRGNIVETLAKNGFVVKVASITEYMYYSNYLLLKGITDPDKSFLERTKVKIKNKFQEMLEYKIKKILSESGLVEFHKIDIKEILRHSKGLISDELLGEGVLTVGLSLKEIITSVSGIISIGPFNCLPSRLSESILNNEMTLEGKQKYGNCKNEKLKKEGVDSLPFLYIETDGNTFPQITQSKLEIFMLQVEKLHRKLHQ
ncbi:MAG: hypothetical protein JXA68_09370 [Ignavibacteriales bacterium]|nr:hypothetical protein [Ignavibacteriales bacterium]